MNTYAIITLYIISALIVGLATSHTTSEATTQFECNANTGDEFNKLSKDSSEQQGELVSDKSAGNQFAMSSLLWNIFTKGFINPLSMFNLSNDPLVFLFGLVTSLIRTLIMIFVSMLIYDKLKNKKVD